MPHAMTDFPRSALLSGFVVGTLIGGGGLAGLSWVAFGGRGDGANDRPIAQVDETRPAEAPTNVNPAAPPDRGITPPPSQGTDQRTSRPLTQPINVPTQPQPQKPPEPQAVQPEPAPVQLSDADIDAILAQLAESNVFRQRGAVGRLLAAEPVEARRAEVTAALLPVVAKGNAFAQREAVRALGTWGTPDVVPRLIELLSEGDNFRQQEAIAALGRLGDARAAESLAARLENFFHHGHAMRALIAIGPPAEPAVSAVLGHATPEVRIRTLQVLEQIGTEKSRPAIESASQSQHPGERGAAEAALRAISAR